MGAITSDFPSLPQDGDVNRITVFAAVYADLIAAGIAVPGTASNVITRAALLAHLQAQAGALIKAELSSDPDSVYGTGMTDAQLAFLLCNPYILATARRYPGTNLTGYQFAAGSTVGGANVVVNPGLGAPGLTAFALAQVAAIRVRATAATVANQGIVMPILTVPSDTTITFSASLPGVPTTGDVFDIGVVVPPKQSPRLHQILKRFPFLPNLLVTADITAAKV